MLSHLDLFSGIGGFSLGLESAGVAKTVAFCDYEKWCQKVLKKHWPHVPIYGDVKELTHERLKADGIDTVDIITGGYPCQPFSVAGSQKGEQDPRHVWPEMFRLVKELRPVFVIGENVSGHIKLGLDTVLENLESEGYTARTFSISAASIGANHKRERVWTLAYSNNKGLRARFGRSNYDYEKKGRVWSFDGGRSESDDEWSDFAPTENEDLDVADSPGKGGREPGHFDKEKRNTESSATQSQSSSSDVANTTGDRWNESQSNKISRSTVRESQEGGMLQSERKSNVADTNSDGHSEGVFEERYKNNAGQNSSALRRESAGKTFGQSDDGGNTKESRADKNLSGPSVSRETDVARPYEVRGISTQSNISQGTISTDTNKENDDRALVSQRQRRLRLSKHRELGDDKETFEGNKIRQGDDNINKQGMADVADTNSKRGRLWETGSKDAKDVGQSPRGQETLGWWDIEPDVGRVAHGVSQRVDRLKGLGNAVVPQIPFLLGLAIREMIENE